MQFGHLPGMGGRARAGFKTGAGGRGRVGTDIRVRVGVHAGVGFA